MGTVTRIYYLAQSWWLTPNPSALRGQEGWIAGAQEFQTSLGNISLSLLPRLGCNGATIAHCSLELLAQAICSWKGCCYSNPMSALASQLLFPTQPSLGYALLVWFSKYGPMEPLEILRPFQVLGSGVRTLRENGRWTAP
ncbi:hypothetical protein AAY473_022260 [Plecturocebus cupreus]